MGVPGPAIFAVYRSWRGAIQQAHITGCRRGRHPRPWQVGIDIQVEFGQAALNPAQQQMFDGVIADRTEAQGDVLELKSRAGIAKGGE